MDKLNKQRLSGLNFYKLFKQRFSDFMPNLKDFGITPNRLTNDRGIYIATLESVSYYAGRLECDAKVTNTFKKATVHRIHTLLSKLNSNSIQRLADDLETKDLWDWQGRLICYKLIKSLGVNPKSK